MGVTGGAAAVKEVYGPKVSLKEAGRGIAAVDMAHWLFNIGTSTSEFANRFHLDRNKCFEYLQNYSDSRFPYTNKRRRHMFFMKL